MKHYEFKIGVIVVIGLFFIMLGLYLTNSLPFLSTGYRIFLKLSYASNIPTGANVKLAGGIKIGRVEKVRENPQEGGVILVLFIENRYKINRDARFVIRSTSLVGERYIDILNYTGNEPYLKDGDTVEGREEITLNEAVSQFFDLVRNVVGTSELPESLDKVVLVIAYIESILREVYQNRDTISTSLRNVSDFSENIKKSVQEINLLLNYLNQVGNNISKVDIQKLNDSIDNLNSTIIQISRLLTNTNTVIGILTDEEVGKSLRRTIRNFETFSKKISDNPSSLINIFR